MKFLILALTLILAAGWTSAGGRSPTPSLVTGEVGGAEYLLNDTLYLVGVRKYETLIEAASHCQRWGGKLAAIPDQETLDEFKRLAANTYVKHPFYWIGVFSECVREHLFVAMNDSRAYTDCSQDPDRCYYYGAGPNPPYELLMDSFADISNCNFTKWVNFDGEEVTFLPFGAHTPELGHHCTALDVFNCENEDGCRIGEYSNHRCFADHDHAFICEKFVERCPQFMEAPPISHFSSSSSLQRAWKKFFGDNIQCGSRFVRIVLNECAKRYVDLRGIRFSVPDGEDCYAVDGNVLVVETGSENCGAITTTELYDGYEYITYSYLIRGELGEYGVPSADDVIRRDASVSIAIICDYEASLYTDLDYGISRVFSQRREEFPINATKNGTVEVTLAAYRDLNFAVPLAAAGGFPEVRVPEMVYVKAATVNNSLGVQVVSCWASPSTNFERIGSVYPLADSCTYENDVVGISPSEFGFASFVFSNDTRSDVFIHCQVQVCPQTGCQGCSVGRRDVHQATSKHRYFGPITFVSSKEGAQQQVDMSPDLCKKKACENRCHVVGKYAMCICPDGTRLKPDGRTCSDADISKQFEWESKEDVDAGFQHHDFTLDVEETTNPKKKSGRMLLYTAMAIFSVSCIICYAVFRRGRSKGAARRTPLL